MSLTLPLVTGSLSLRSRRTPAIGSELARCEIERNGVYVGTVVYVARKHRSGGTSYGWRPERAGQSAALTTKADAVERLTG